jgi:hypothetical protein
MSLTSCCQAGTVRRSARKAILVFKAWRKLAVRTLMSASVRAPLTATPPTAASEREMVVCKLFDGDSMHKRGKAEVVSLAEANHRRLKVGLKSTTSGTNRDKSLRIAE